MFDSVKSLLVPKLSLSLVGAGKLGVGDNTSLSTTGVREGKTGEQVVGQAHGKYYEAALRGNLYSAVNLTARATTATLTTSPPITIYNPLGSGKFLAIKRAGFSSANVSTGVFGTGTLFHCVYTLSGPTATQGGTVPTGTAITPVNCLVGAANNSVATALEAVTLHTTAGAIVMPFVNLSEVASGTIAGNSNTCFDDLDGSIVLGPGSGYCMASIAAALANAQTAWFSVVWEEVPIS